ncbi:MAG: MMPL family transporter [Acidimicrobiales bacterium]
MERFWRTIAVGLGKYWWAVGLVVLAITGVLAIGATRIEFATGQDSYLNTDSQASIDNVEFQNTFGGEAVILLFSSEGEATIDDLMSDANRAELTRLEAALRAVPEVHAVVTPLVSMEFSSAILDESVATQALARATGVDDDEESAARRSIDTSVSLARLSAARPADLANPNWIELLLWDNTGYEVDGGAITTTPSFEDRRIRRSLESTYPDKYTAVGGVILEGNADLDTLSSGTEAILEIMASADLEGFEVTTTGSPVFLKDINDYLQGGMLTLGAAAVAIMALVLAVTFRVRWRLLPLLAVLIAVAWTFSLLGLIGIDLSLVTISGLPILIGLGVDFAIQVHNRVEEEVVLARASNPIQETLANLGPPLVAATFAAVAAFLVMRISLVPMIRDFGVMLAIGIVIILIVGILVPTAVLGIREYRARTESLAELSPVERGIVALGGLPQKFVIPLIIASVGLLLAGIALEDQFEIESDPVRWVNQDTDTVRDIRRLENETGFESTLGVLIEANNVRDQAVIDLVWDFIEANEDGTVIRNSSSMVSTLSKIINYDDSVNPVPPRAEDVVALIDVMPDDIRRVLINDEGTAAQLNLRLGPAPLADDAILVAALNEDLAARIDALDLPADSILRTDLDSGQQPVRAVPAGLAVVGVGLLENLSANRAILTYLALATAGLWILLRFRSAARALLAMVPVLLAVGAASVIVAVLGLTLSPLTTVSGPLVIASCTEFSILILGRYLEERQRGLTPKEATDRASARTGRAFFTSALTTIGGFGVLVFSALPLLSDFGMIVTLNVAVALLSALVVMPPLLVWADNKNWLGIDQTAQADEYAVVLADRPRPGLLVAGAAVLAIGVALFLSADSEEGNAAEIEYSAVALPTTTTTTTTIDPTVEPPPQEEIDVTQFGTDRPGGFIDGALFDLLTNPDVGVDPQSAVCAATVLLERFTEDQLLNEFQVLTFTDEAVVPVVAAAQDCGIDDASIDTALTIARGG